jgi:hypothetical protein
VGGAAAAQDEATGAAQANIYPTADFVCDGMFRTMVTVDGLQTDWEAEAGEVDRVATLIAGEAEYDWTGPADASFRFWCRYTADRIYLAVVGRDNVVTGPRSRFGGDRLEIWIAAGPRGTPVAIEVPLWVLAEEGRAIPRFSHGDEGELANSIAEVAPRENGYFAEIGIAIADLPAAGPLFGPLAFAITQRDMDFDGDGEREVVVATAPTGPEGIAGTLRTNAVERRLAEISRQTMFDAAARGSITHQVWAEFGGRPGMDLAFLLGDMLIVTGEGFDEFSWTASTIRTTDEHEALSLEAADLDGDGVAELLYRFVRPLRRLDDDRDVRQEMLLAYRLEDSTLTRLFAHEVANELPGEWRIESPIRLVERGDGLAVWIERPESDLTAERYVDHDAGDMVDYERMLLPWDETRRVEWTVNSRGASATRR